MSDLSQLKTKVNSLSKTSSNDREFRDAFKHIEEASKIPANTHSNELSEILTNFRDNKLNGRPTLNRTRKDAKDLDENLKLSTIAKSIKAINDRNIAITNLYVKLNEQAQKAVKDANLLKTIQNILDKTTATVTVIKDFIDALEESNTSEKDNLKALIDALAQISTIFKS